MLCRARRAAAVLGLYLGVLVVAAPFARQTPSSEPYVPQQSDRPLPVEGDEPGFVPIFNGTNLDGWEGDPTYWRVEDGVLVGEITPETVIKRNTFIVWRGGSPADFDLKLDFRISAAGNSGINYRSTLLPPEPETRFPMRGYQFDIDGRRRYTGNNYEERGRLFLAVRGQYTRVVGTRPPVLLTTFGDADALGEVASDDWNSVHIIARGPMLTHLLNGRLMSVTVDDDEAHRPVDGLIGMQVHQGPPMKVEYRNIRIKLND